MTTVNFIQTCTIVNFDLNIILLYKITLGLDTGSETVTAIPQQMLTMFDDNIGLLAFLSKQNGEIV